ncbi:Hypothetical predicted protein [Olea europaea subsp. europaea]|uniref:Dirigent protein n=1 Tax=Olea europaea subsp. europaea TaxID=158383 RepID=A0A8S0PUS0_OLEEU|nr:Hypothetical predicted protein [Olea europaea subsp. europaea]
MGNLGIIMSKFLSFFTGCMAMPSRANETDQESSRFKNLYIGKEKTTTLHIYVQDELGGENPTVLEVARSNITSTSTTSFGQVRVLDDLVTAGPDRTSEKVGRAQGLITFSDLQESALTMNLNFVFTSGPYNGSTLCMLGRNPMGKKYRELAIVGGTGVFRLARGYAITNIYSYDVNTSHGVLEYNIYVAYVEGLNADQGELSANKT